jgi:uncharacterized membrane protein YccF (DUF307 family)
MIFILKVMAYLVLFLVAIVCFVSIIGIPLGIRVLYVMTKLNIDGEEYV